MSLDLGILIIWNYLGLLENIVNMDIQRNVSNYLDTAKVKLHNHIPNKRYIISHKTHSWLTLGNGTEKRRINGRNRLWSRLDGISCYTCKSEKHKWVLKFYTSLII